ncbi:MAG: glycosyltransferase family 4 protein, partial [Desulfitobacteriaceae bacterium]|nr:glycosyltransferase family 4 protein [Desulfitobacteriaceae bacterium]
RISDICETLVNNGHDVTVLTGLPNYPEGRVLDDYRQGKKREEVINGVKVLRSVEIGRGSSKPGLFLNYLSFAISASLKAMFMKEILDVVLVNQLSPVMMGIPAMVYKKKHNKKILFYCLDLWPASLTAGGIKERSIVYKVFLKMSQWIYNSADVILVTSRMFREYFKNNLGIDTEKINHLPQYAEDIFNQSVVIPANDKFNFVFAGNIGDMQSVETIIKAANELRNHADIIFHIVGDGSKLDECKRISNEMSLQNVEFYGRRPVSEMPHFYGMADAMLITLKGNKIISYTLPGKVQSYMAASKPILGAINGETRHVIEESGCGLCCAAEDYKGLADLVLEFCNSDKKEQMGLNAREFYCKNYSKDKFIAELEKVLVSLGA